MCGVGEGCRNVCGNHNVVQWESAKSRALLIRERWEIQGVAVRREDHASLLQSRVSHDLQARRADLS